MINFITLIILGDLNAQNTMWHCNSTNAKGRIIEKILQDQNISQLNDYSPTHYTNHTNTTSVIDLGLCSSNILPDFLGECFESALWK